MNLINFQQWLKESLSWKVWIFKWKKNNKNKRALELLVHLNNKSFTNKP